MSRQPNSHSTCSRFSITRRRIVTYGKQCSTVRKVRRFICSSIRPRALPATVKGVSYLPRQQTFSQIGYMNCFTLVVCSKNLVRRLSSCSLKKGST